VTEEEVRIVLEELVSLPRETEWVEFKKDYVKPEEIGQYISALSNSAGLHKKNAGYLVWGIENNTHRVVGTTFKPHERKVKGQELESWLAHHLSPRINFKIHEFQHGGCGVVIFEIQPCRHTPVRFRETEFIRIGSYKKKLREYPEKERALWALLSKTPFEQGVAVAGVTPDQVLALIDYPGYFELMNQSLPADKSGILDRLRAEKIILRKGEGRYDISNLGGILFAKKLSEFDTLARKAVRVVIYKGDNRIETLKETVGRKGYATGFEGLISYINDQLPSNEQIVRALRREVKMYPEIAVRELVANAIIHQDFSMAGDSPLVEIFSDRIEITNSGKPLIDTMRFIDEPPQSRNEALAAFMRRLNICEERGSGIDKVIFHVEVFQLPAPEFLVTENHTKAVLFAHKKLSQMTRNDRIRACYQHACLRCVSNEQLTNASLRKRFSIEDKNYATASRIIAETLKKKLIKPHDPSSKSRKHAKYVPYWA